MDEPTKPQGGVMDIQPPAPKPANSPASESQQPPVTHDAAPASGSAAENIPASVPVSTQSAEAPVAGPPAEPQQQSNDGAGSSETIQPQSTNKPGDNKALGVPDAHKQPLSHRPRGTIVVALIIAAALAGVTVFLYLKSNNSGTVKPKEQATETVAPAETATPATGTDIDQTTSAIDESIQQIDDTKDFSSGDLSDATLGL